MTCFARKSSRGPLVEEGFRGRWPGRLGWGLFLSFACTLTAQSESPIILRNATPDTGIAFQHTDGSSGRRYYVETMASGLATFDYDGDGLVDIYFLNGAPLPGSTFDRPPTNALYRNLGGFRFTDVTESAGVGDQGYGLGVAVADYDNDGQPDLYINNFGPNVLYRNQGDGTFRDVTAQTRLARGDTIGAGANFFDMDKDGLLDLFVANYVVFRLEANVTRVSRGLPSYAGPRDFPAQPNRLFRNPGEGPWIDVTHSSGISAHAGRGMGTICFDCDTDGDTDIFVCNDTMANFLFLNDGTGKFQEAGLASGLAFNYMGNEVSSMGPDCTDYDHDGLLDLFMTDYQGQMPVLFRGLGGGLFEDVAVQAQVGEGSFPYVKWGCGFADFDNDGHKDIFFACGHTEDNAELVDMRTSYLSYPILLRNGGNGKFVNISAQAGDGMRVKAVGRGVGLDDLDNDGLIDVVILSARRPPIVLRNQSPTTNHWIQIRLRGVKTNRDGVGSRVRVVAGDLVQLAEVHSGRGYQSHFGSRLHFGLGSRTQVDRIEVHWLGGGTDLFGACPADRVIVLTEGTSPEAEGR